MEKKHAKKKDGGGLYIAICCCILVIALIGYANNVSQKNKEDTEFLTEQAGENTVVPEIVKKDESEAEIKTEPIVAVEEKKEEVASPVTKTAEAEEVLEFLAPVGGKVTGEFSDKQVFYEKIEEWRTHNGVDLEAEVGASVLAAMDGKVSKVFMGKLGYAIQIDHENGLSTVYGNLDENPVVAIGDNVKKGDVVGRVGTSALSDIADTPHLHFEVIENGKYKNPTEYLNR